MATNFAPSATRRIGATRSPSGLGVTFLGMMVDQEQLLKEIDELKALEALDSDSIDKMIFELKKVKVQIRRLMLPWYVKLWMWIKRQDWRKADV